MSSVSARVVAFEDLDVWKDSMRLAVHVYEVMNESKHYGLKDQMQRSSVSIPSNIAEGFDRETNNEFIRYLFIARGSCSELRTQLYLAARTQIIPEPTVLEMIDRTKQIPASSPP